MSYRPVVLCVLDGWGIAPDSAGNAVTRAKTPRLDRLFRAYPHARLEASGRAVGLPDGVMGNSEVGHLTMGAGYIQYQELVRINDSIDDGSFYRNEALIAACRAVKPGRTLHLLGLLSTGGVHADIRHLNAITELARREEVGNVADQRSGRPSRIAYHCFLDGRDMPPRSALELLSHVDAPIATIHGRYWAMDRDKRWDRVERSWRAIVDAEGPRVGSVSEAVLACYEKVDCRDELLEPAVVGDGARVEDGDAVVFFNFRPDRARELTWAFMQPGFDGFTPKRRPKLSMYATMTDYHVDIEDVAIAFPRQEVEPLAAILAEHRLRQFHTAETEKYAHVTYFFNGGHEDPYAGEERVLVPSPKVATYDLQPEMSAPAVAETCAKAVQEGRFDFVIVNFANPDMVGHTGDIDATERAMATTDAAVGAVVDATLAAGGCVLLTADHGNAEEMLFPDGGKNTQHSTNPVPVLFIAADASRYALRDGGLQDVAPTILELLRLPAPERMTGRSLLVTKRE
ncbi:MAG: 2,3-bisphosphoglycerate-independent phosphoglycerate mutase [Chloroflexota bacterium]|nr:2,3-bisphosphoglycerate-independent phosphoglycerate mutase [Chloroflexota bacterium]MDE3193520.1 2,3-bisphosphoglycerate-independent phosphoglycerate mutase [Chloroflexota bacterium]